VSRALPVLYAIACGSPVASHIGHLVGLAQQAGWQVCVVATPDGRKFIDVPEVAAQTGHPVRSEFKNPGDLDVLPAADAFVVAPATVNTVNKWACGIADTLALGMLVEGYGLGVPIVVMPYTNTAMAAHPAFRESLGRLREWGVRVLFGDDVLVLPSPGDGAGQAAEFPWAVALAALGPAPPAGAGAGGWHVGPGAAGPWSTTSHGQPTRRARTAPPTPRPAPAAVRPRRPGAAR
jgi:hypothetical protein